MRPQFINIESLNVRQSSNDVVRQSNSIQDNSVIMIQEQDHVAHSKSHRIENGSSMIHDENASPVDVREEMKIEVNEEEKLMDEICKEQEEEDVKRNESSKSPSPEK